MKRRNIVMMMACIGFLGAMAEEKADSTAGVNLKEVVVQGKRAWIEGNKAIFLPTKKEKNLANDPASLVDRMSILP